MTTKEEYLGEEENWLREHYDMYREALENLSDPAYVRALLRGIEDKLTPILHFNPREDEAHAAVFAIGAVQAKMEKLLTDLDFVDDYESRRDDVNEQTASQLEESQSDQLIERGEL